MRTLERPAREERAVRIALLWPRGFDPSTTLPLPLGYLKSNLDSERYDVRILDCAVRGWGADSSQVRRWLADFAPDMVGVSTWSPMFPEALSLLATVRELVPNAVTVLGGAHPSSYAERSLEHSEVDYVVAGEAEFAFPRLVDELQKGEPSLASVPGLVWRQDDGTLGQNDKERPELDAIVLPDYEAIGLDVYNRHGYRWNSPPVPNAPLWLTRGCPYRCQYCAAPDLNGRLIRRHSVEYALSWIRGLYDKRGIRWFNIIDDNFTYDVRWAKEFCRALIELNLPGVGFGTPNGIRMKRGDPELWSLMKQAGWEHVIVAPESGSTDTLERMKKDLKVGEVPRIVREIQDAGLRCQAFFIVGYPGETEKDLQESFALIRECKFNFVFLANFQPLPGTPVYDDLVAAGEIEDGLIPYNFSDAMRVYSPEGLEGFNFSKFMLKTYLMMAVSNPANVPYQLSILHRLYKPQFVGKKLLRVVWSAVRPGGKQPVPRFVPMHQQAAAVHGSPSTGS